MKIRGKMRYWAASLCGVAVIMLFVAAADGFRMGRGMTVLVNMFRDLSLYYVDEVDPDRMLADAAEGMTMSLDPYTEYISEEDMMTFQQMTKGRYGGIGSLIRQKGDYVVFAEPYRGSPADRAGIVIGDAIVEIDGKDAKGMTTQDVSNILKGEPGTTVKLKVRKFYTDEIETVRITREVISLPGVSYFGMVSDTVGYIGHTDFTEDCSNDMRNAVMQLRSEGAKALILDYRGNGGGILQEAVKILSFFVPKGTEVVSMRGRTEETSAAFHTQNEPIDREMPVVVLTDTGSASAAEIVSGALQDLDRAVLMGRRTFGKGLVQSTRPLDYNSYLKLTTAKYYLPSGRCIQAIDYAKRAEDGSLSYIPDSLIVEYDTKGGRKVYDGGGVMPDVRIPAEYHSRFAYIVYGRNYISDFVDVFIKELGDREVVPGEFELTDDDYSRFVRFMADKDVEWESETKRTLAAMKEKARQERYIDSIGEELAIIEGKLKDDMETSLMLYRKELTDLIENEVILRKHHSYGMRKHNVGKDNDIKEALELLADPARYDRIITSQDTQRK